MLEELSPEKWRIVRKHKVLTTQLFDDYLFASDAAIFHKFTSRFHAVVSSTVFQALGAGCPIFVPRQSDFFHSWRNEVLHYRDITALNKQMIDFFGSEKKQKALAEAANRFVEDHSPKNTAKRFVALFEQLLK